MIASQPLIRAGSPSTVTALARRISSKTILLQYELSRAMGVPEAALAQLDLDTAHLFDPDGTIPEDAVYSHLELVAEHLQDALPRFVVALAEQHRTTTLGLPGFAMRSASDVRAGLAVMHRYQHLTNTLASFDLVEQGEIAQWSEHRFGPTRLCHVLATEVSVMVAVNIARELAQGDFTPLKVEIRSSEAPSEYRDFCGCPVGAGAPRGTMSFARPLLDLPLGTANEDMSQYFHGELERRLRTADSAAPVISEVRNALGDQLMRGVPSLEAVAKTLGVSGRTLQRRLRDAETTFGEVVDGLRRDLAAAYLVNPAYTAAEVAFLLGYAEASSFHRAFKRWTGRTPEVYRAEHLPSEA